jgi:hypothetical protein
MSIAPEWVEKFIQGPEERHVPGNYGSYSLALTKELGRK